MALASRNEAPGKGRGEPLWAVVDGARDPRLSEALSLVLNPCTCLFAGDLTEELRRAAPYLVRLYPGDRFSDRLIERAREEPWCILIRSPVSMNRLRRHLKTLLRVRDERQRLLYFRFYDPRVLGLYLPTCTSAELALVFGAAVTEFLVQDGGVLRSFRNDDGVLAIEEAAAFSAPAVSQANVDAAQKQKGAAR